MNLDGAMENDIEANAILEERRRRQGLCLRGSMSGGQHFIMAVFGSGSSMGRGNKGNPVSDVAHAVRESFGRTVAWLLDAYKQTDDVDVVHVQRISLNDPLWIILI
jgi:hypothetical protein